MTAPIPISTNGNPPSPGTSSTASVSPRTPFLAPPAPNGTLGSSPTNPAIRWAPGLSLSKSPTTGGQPHIVPASAPITEDHEHDSLEFGDPTHSKEKSWTAHSRRAASMSLASGQTAAGGSITSMLTGFGSTAPPPLSPPLEPPSGLGASVGSPLGTSFLAGGLPQGGVLADKAAKAQGVIRRLSIGGSGAYRPSFLSPTSAATTTAMSPPNNIAPLPKPVVESKPAPLPQPANPTEPPPSFARGRRFSENGSIKKRGVSPMGERMLRDHAAHF